jgi:hypothetical protein
MKKLLAVLMAGALASGAMALVGCERKTESERELEQVGDRIEDRLEDVGDRIEDIGDDIEDRLD